MWDRGLNEHTDGLLTQLTQSTLKNPAHYAGLFLVFFFVAFDIDIV